MAGLTQQLLDVDVAVKRLAQMLGHTRRADDVRRQLAELRRSVAKIKLADLVAHAADLDGADLVRQAIDTAIRAGVGWTEVAAIVNQASERRAG